MKRAVFMTLAVALALSVGLLAQGKPDFTGSWVLDPAKSVMGGGPGGGMGGGRPGGGAPGPVKIAQTAAELTIEQTMGENTMKTIYKLDGTESVNESPRGKSTIVSKWDGAKLVSAIKRETQRGTMESTETRSLAADGTMVVERTSTGPNGPNTMKMVYNKQK
jgi:hypothetical protein